jgi:hypothetical protein
MYTSHFVIIFLNCKETLWTFCISWPAHYPYVNQGLELKIVYCRPVLRKYATSVTAFLRRM